LSRAKGVTSNQERFNNLKISAHSSMPFWVGLKDTMTALPQNLLSGYERFRTNRYREEARRYAELADGQSPGTMIIACADSRVDPATIFGAAPGELFVVRNVANLVPPCSTSTSDLHGTSAAIEFAVCQLGIRHIVVMGHGNCGGISASLATAENKSVGQFVKPWVDLLSDSRDAILADKSLTDQPARQTALEHEGVCLSLENLMSFPFVSEAVAANQLALHGVWFAIGSGILHWFNGDAGRFETIES
jgi:carbonic anhydrase